MADQKILRTYQGAAAIVTGGASGIGKALAQELARRGAEVVLADLQADSAGKAAAEIRSAGGKASSAGLDVADADAVKKLVTDVFMRTGRLDYMFNNAGVVVSGAVHELKTDDWEYIVRVNVLGVVNGITAAYPLMLMQGFGHMVNTGSIAGLIAAPGQVAYSMTKHAVVGLSRSLRGQAGLMGIRVSVLCPGLIQTDMLENGGKFGRNYREIDPEMRRKLAEEARPMPSDLFARRALDAVAKNKAVIVEPAWWRRVWRLNHVFPEYSIAPA